MKIFTKLMAVGGILFAGIQLIRPAITHPPVTAEIQAPEPVRQVLRNSCYNCHSNETRLAWFDEIAPANWLVAHDVKEARAHLNFSEIGKLAPAAQRAALYEAVNMVRLGAMPLPSYKHAHPGAAVTADGLAILENYLKPFGAVNAVGPEAMSEAAAQTKSVAPAHVADELNGLPFFADYKDWKPISSTDRGDNHTLRQILGNDVAIRAIAEKKVQPWPDGSVFAKIAWDAVPDADGVLQAGKFVQVEFMVKDKAKYASTEGWGFGRWRGADLKPYGKDPGFASECAGCHAPMRKNDYVYTLPLERSGQ